MGLQVTPFTLTKVLQLYETKNSRHSTMIVGGTGSAKTTSWRILQATLTSLCRAGDPNFNIVRVCSWNTEVTSRDKWWLGGLGTIRKSRGKC
jgi:dynein heavy chain